MTNSQIFWRRVWLITAAVLIIAAYVNGFRISNAIFLSDCRLATILTFISSFCLVMGNKEYAKDFFQCDKLWYASSSGFIRIAFILLIFDSIFLALTTIIIDPSVKRALYPEQMQFLLPAFAILLIVVLNRPHPFVGFSRQYYPPKKVSQRRSYAQQVASSPLIKQRIETGKNAAKKVRDSLSKGIGLLKRK